MLRRRLFSRLPAYASTRAKEMFPEAYKHNQEIKVDYRLGMSLLMVVSILLVVVGLSLVTFRLAWKKAGGEIEKAAGDVKTGQYFSQANARGANAKTGG